MLSILLVAGLALAQQQDSTYSSERVRTIVAGAAARNSSPPAGLQSYSARVETELSFVQAQADGREVLLQLEQLASDVAWRADGAVRQDIIGYRSQTLGASFSGLSFFEIPFLVPTLFADRLDLVRTTGPVRSETGQLLRRRTLHPFAAGREAVYSFSNGDTVDIVRLPDRTLTIVRVHVVPRTEPRLPTLLFEGDIDLDADRFHIVRMQGRLIPSGRSSSFLSNFLQGVLYVKLENAEYDEAFWLPREQRFEAQAVSRIGEGRTLFRAVSRVVDLRPNDEAALARVPSLDEYPYGQLVVGSMSAMSRFRDWNTPIGELSEGADAHDFDAYAPASLQPHAQSRLTFGARYLSQLIRFNRVEGLYTGAGLGYRLADSAKIRAHAGYAWSEQAVRGGVELEQRVSGWDLRARAERQLAHTSDFLNALQQEPGVTPLLVGDQYDFVDRRVASVIARRPSAAGIALRIEAGRAADRNVTEHVGNFTDSLALTGRADEGAYWIGRAELQRNASAGALSLQPGLGWLLRYEGATGDIAWNRVEAAATLRRMAGPFTFAARADAGVVAADPVPAQALFEFSNATLPGYDDVAIFAGDRAALGRVSLMYTLPVFRSPLRVGSLYLPALAPSPAVGFYAGWTDARTETLPVLQRIGWTVTDGARTSIDLRMRFFGGSVSVGAARALQDSAKWKFVWGWTTEF